MDNSLISGMAAIFGSIVGSSATVATAWITQRTRNKREMIRAETNKREELYGKFLSECSKRLIDSFERSLDKPEKLLTTYELLNRIRLFSSKPVLAEAERIVKFITDQYFLPNLSIEQLRARVSPEEDPLKPFSEACRFELKSMSGDV